MRDQYQEELKQQMEEQKRRKEVEKLKLKEVDAADERKLEAQRHEIGKIEHQELVKEGKRKVDDYTPQDP